MGCIVVISGPSGAGKNTVYDGLLEKDADFAHTISVTTRTPRDGEVNGKDYYFVTKEEFEKRKENEEFLEYVQYGENSYGTLKSEVKRLCDADKIVIMIIDVYGALRIKEIFPEAITIFLTPPSEEELSKRLANRGTDSAEVILSRLNIAKNELSLADKYDYQVVNAHLNDCIDEVYTIIKNH